MKYIFNQWYCAMHNLYYSGNMCPKCASGQDKCNGGGYVSNGVRMWCVIASIVSVLIVIVTCAGMAQADAITVVYRGTEVLESGEPPFNVYYIDCKPDSNGGTLVDIQISYVDGTIETRTGKYCDTKLYVNGTLHDGVIVHDDGTHAVTVVGAVSAPGTPEPTATITAVPPTAAATATVQPTPQTVATSMPTQEPEEVTTRNVYLPAVMR